MKIILVANTDWYLYNFRRNLALALQARGDDVLLVSPDGPYGAQMRAAGLRWQPLPMLRRGLNPFSEARALMHLVRLFHRERPDLVHAFTLKSIVYALLAARVTGVPAHIASVDGLGYVFTARSLKARALRAPVRALLRLALGGAGVRLILQNRNDRDWFLRTRLFAARDIELTPGVGVDCRRFQPTAAPRAAGAPFRVLMAARLLWDKGVADYVEAALQLREQGCSITCLLAGAPDHGNPASIPERQLDAWTQAGSIERLGHVEDMPRLLQSVDAVVLPSFREGLPSSLIEAAACGLPRIATDVPGCREAITDGVDGMLVPVHDPAALAAAIARLADDPALCRRLGAAARQRALAEFDERFVIASILVHYQSLFATTPRDA